MNNVNFKTETFTIKCGLNKFAKKNEILISKINEDVLEISSLMIEVSLLFNFHYCRLLQSDSNIDEKPNFLNFFYQLKGKSKLDEEFQNLISVKVYNSQHRTYLIQNAAKIFETNVKNNIIIHMYPRVKRYFKLKFPNIDKKILYKILKYLFEKGASVDSISNEYLKTFRTEFKLSNEFSFHELETSWWKYINFLFKLQTYFNQFRNLENPEAMQRVKSFNLFPIFSFGRKHILYTTDAFRELLASLQLIQNKDDRNPKIFRENAKSYWSEYFNINKFENELTSLICISKILLLNIA